MMLPSVCRSIQGVKKTAGDALPYITSMTELSDFILAVTKSERNSAQVNLCRTRFSCSNWAAHFGDLVAPAGFRRVLSHFPRGIRN